MKFFSPFFLSWALLLAVGLQPVSFGLAAERSNRSDLAGWANSVVTMEIAREEIRLLPALEPAHEPVQKTGLVIGERQILTTADEMFDRTLCVSRKMGVDDGGSVRWPG